MQVPTEVISHLVFGLPRGLNHLRGTQDVALMGLPVVLKSGYIDLPISVSTV